MKKTVIASLSCFLAFCFIVAGSIGYIYYDFHVNGVESAKFRYKDNFNDKVHLSVTNAVAEYSDGAISSTSDHIDYRGIVIYASTETAPGTGTLILKINQQVCPYSPFEMHYIGFSRGNKNADGEYVSVSVPHQTAYDKNGRKLTLEPAGSNGINEVGFHTTEFYIRYDDFGDYLKAEDIEKAFPISAELDGHIVDVSRASWF